MPLNEESETQVLSDSLYSDISPTLEMVQAIEEQQLAIKASLEDMPISSKGGGLQPSLVQYSRSDDQYLSATQNLTFVPPEQRHPLIFFPRNSTTATTVRTHEQNYVIRHGSNSILIGSIALLVTAYILIGVQGGIDTATLFTLSLLPVFFILGCLRVYSQCQISIALMVEMFWSGALLSILVASILELVSEYQTKKIWECQAMKPSILCDLRFLIVVIVGVGFVEEFSKFLPLSRIKTDESDFPTHHVWWFRLVECPHSFVLAGLCSAAGFAAIENIKYVFSSEKEAGIGTSLWRAVLAIPFHLACTTYATCQLSRLLFSTVENSQTSSMNQPNNPPELVFLTRGSITESPNSHHHIHPLHFKHVSFMEYLKCLSLPSILHGLYDVGLFLAAQLMGLAEKSTLLPLSWTQIAGTVPMLNLTLNDHSIGGDSSKPSDASELYEILAVCCLGLSLGSYILILVLSVLAWRDLKNIEISITSSAFVPNTNDFMNEQIQISQYAMNSSVQSDGFASSSPQESLVYDFRRQAPHLSEPYLSNRDRATGTVSNLSNLRYSNQT